MHRHGYKGRKLGRDKDQRRALLKSMAASLIEFGSVETTLPKAKELRPYVEKLVTKAKAGDLHNRRQVIAGLGDMTAVDILYDEVVPSVKERDSGYLRIERSDLRRGDGAQMARVSFVDDIVAETKPAKTSKDDAKTDKADKAAEKKPAKETAK